MNEYTAMKYIYIYMCVYICIYMCVRVRAKACVAMITDFSVDFLPSIERERIFDKERASKRDKGALGLILFGISDS